MLGVDDPQHQHTPRRGQRKRSTDRQVRPPDPRRRSDREPGTGSDVSAIATRAVRDGDAYVVTDAKTFVTSGTRADFVTTAVRTGADGHRGVSLLVIDTTSEGFRVATKLDKTGWLCSDTDELKFDQVRVPADNLVGTKEPVSSRSCAGSSPSAS